MTPKPLVKRKTSYHMSVGIYGLEQRLGGKGWEILEDDNGKMLTKAEVMTEIERCKKLGYKVIPTCDNIDQDGRCMGHEEDL